MGNILLSILNMSINASFVILVVCIARLLLKKTPKVISYALWAVVAFRLVVPYSIESTFSLMPIKTDPIPQSILFEAQPRSESATGIKTIDGDTATAPTQPRPSIASPASTASATSSLAITPSIAAAASAAATGSNPTSQAIFGVIPLQLCLSAGTVLWLLGLTVMLIHSFISMAKLKRNLRRAVLLEENIYESSYIKTPFVLGFLKPKIYLPPALKPEEKCYVVLHEQIHIRRFDHMINLFAYLILCIHWFNPLVWIAFVLMGTDMELSCDEYVIAELGANIKKDYSVSLLSFSTGKHLLSGCPLAFSEVALKTRINNVLSFKKSSKAVISAAIIFVAVLSVGLATNHAGAGKTSESGIDNAAAAIKSADRAASTNRNMNQGITANRSKDRVTKWTEPTLEALVRETLGKPDGDIMLSELDHVWGIELFGDTHIYFNADGGYEMYKNEDGSYKTFDVLEVTNVDLRGISSESNLPVDGAYSVDGVHYTRGSITKLADFANFRNIKFLSVFKNSLKDMRGLSGLDRLSEIRLVDCAIQDAESLSELQQIIALDLRKNKISDIKPLTKLVQIKYLNLRNNEIKNLEGLSSISGLEDLEVASNPIEDLDPLRSLTNLRWLFVEDTRINDLSPLSDLTLLHHLSMGNLDTAHIDMAPLSTLVNLESLVAEQDRAELMNLRILTQFQYLWYIDILPNVNLSEEEISWFKAHLPNYTMNPTLNFFAN